ncbi:MAG: 2'-5' RNA ligase family protein [Bacteroidetes bacterium]|nr:2'-5' RNA ligase family protein [Bacteroidota bacterium]
MKGKYFIAIIPPSPIFEECLAIKEYFRDHYGSKGALRSPSHITLHMPFLWRADRESDLLDHLKQCAEQLSPADIELKGFGCFAPRVIFIHVENTEPLVQMQRQVRKYCREELNLLNADFQEKPFHPHMTVAFRDLKKKDFPAAWNEFGSKSFDARFRTTHVTLLKHEGLKWKVHANFEIPTGSAEL